MCTAEWFFELTSIHSHCSTHPSPLRHPTHTHTHTHLLMVSFLFADKCPLALEPYQCHEGFKHLCETDEECRVGGQYCCFDGCRRRCQFPQGRGEGWGGLTHFSSVRERSRWWTSEGWITQKKKNVRMFLLPKLHSIWLVYGPARRERIWNVPKDPSGRGATKIVQMRLYGCSSLLNNSSIDILARGCCNSRSLHHRQIFPNR